jgi:hypothetical protein
VVRFCTRAESRIWETGFREVLIGENSELCSRLAEFHLQL